MCLHSGTTFAIFREWISLFQTLSHCQLNYVLIFFRLCKTGSRRAWTNLLKMILDFSISHDFFTSSIDNFSTKNVYFRGILEFDTKTFDPNMQRIQTRSLLSFLHETANLNKRVHALAIFVTIFEVGNLNKQTYGCQPKNRGVYPPKWIVYNGKPY